MGNGNASSDSCQRTVEDTMYQECIKKIEDVRRTPDKDHLVKCGNLNNDDYVQLWGMRGFHPLKADKKINATFAVLAIKANIERTTTTMPTTEYQQCIKKIDDIQTTPGREDIITCANLSLDDYSRLYHYPSLYPLRKITIVDATFAVKQIRALFSFHKTYTTSYIVIDNIHENKLKPTSHFNVFCLWLSLKQREKKRSTIWMGLLQISVT